MKNSFLLLPLSSLNRVGSSLVEYLIKLVGRNKIFDLLLHKLLRTENISILPRLFEAQNDELIIIKAKVETYVEPTNKRQPFKVICYTPTGYVTLVFFKIFPSQIAKMKIGSEIAIFGSLQKIAGENQITHPIEILPASEIEKLPKINVVYPLSAKIPQKFLTQKIKEILVKLEDEDEEWIDKKFLQNQQWQGFSTSLKNFHYFNNSSLPKQKISESDWQKASKRLAFDELLAWQIAVLMAKEVLQKKKIFESKKNNHENFAQKFLSNLPFNPTTAQLKAIKEIEAEIFSTKKMLRILQGDVGSGKTIVAIAACLNAKSQQKQSCVIAPTTVLAKQHFSYFSKLLEGFNLHLEILTSATTKKQKEKLLQNLIEGKTDILISTHAVLESDVKFKSLGFAVIDEQHRFGVLQRLKLIEKDQNVDVLLMSATPIPRSLMMALYGDMDISILNEKPKNRQHIETLIISQKKADELYEAMKRALLRDEKIYWICPSIEFLEEIELTSVNKKFEELVKIFGEKKVGLLHGKMKESEKEKIMNEFAKSSGDPRILVSTTVIEVGIDVPEATVIVIENAEHFGLAQLHQLRGRVGRSDKKSFCILLYGEKFGVNARKRLNILRQSNDGFFIAEEDLKIRGSGEIIGTKQSGFPEFKIADLSVDSDLLKVAHKNAQLILLDDPHLKKPQSKKYRYLLQLFSYEDCLKIITSG